MPRRDGTGPLGNGPIGLGRGSVGLGRGPVGQGRGGSARRLDGGSISRCVDGYCVCPNCGKKLQHERAIPCTSVKCPDCGTTMIRE